MERVGEHPVPVGPLAVRWLAYELEEQRAGVATRARVRLENAGTAPWRSRGREGVQLAYHWLDPLGNAIVWDGARTAFPDVVRPGETVELESTLVAPRPPGRYRLAFDLVEEFRFWFQELGSTPLDLPVDVRPRIDERRLAVRVHGPLDRSSKRPSQRRRSRSSPRTPSPWRTSCRASSRLPTGRACCSTRTQRATRQSDRRSKPSRAATDDGLAAWAPGGGRNPRFGEPLLLPSLLEGLEPSMHEGLPAYTGRDGLFEGRAVVRLRSRSGRRSG